MNSILELLLDFINSISLPPFLLPVLIIAIIIFIYLVLSRKGRRFLLLEKRLQVLDGRLYALENHVNQLNQNPQPALQSNTDLINQTIQSLPAQIIQQVSQSLEGRLQTIENQVHQLNQNQKKAFELESTLFHQTTEELPAQMVKQVSQSVTQSMEERLQMIENQVNQLNQNQQTALQSESVLIHQTTEELPAQIIQQVSRSVSQSLEERLLAIEAQINQLNQNQQTALQLESVLLNQTTEWLSEQGIKQMSQPLADNLPDTSNEKPELSPFAKAMIREFNERDDFGQIYAASLLTLSRMEESFGEGDKIAQGNKYNLQEDKQGIFWAIKELTSKNYLLVLNQDRLTPQQFKNTFQFSIKYINQVFDCRKEFDRNKHTGVKMIYPAIAVKNQYGGSEQIELKVRGELEFY